MTGRTTLAFEAWRQSAMTAGGVDGPPEAIWTVADLGPLEELDNHTLIAVLGLHLARAEAVGQTVLLIPRPVLEIMLRTLQDRLAGRPQRRGPPPRHWLVRRFDRWAMAEVRARTSELVAEGQAFLEAQDMAAEEVAAVRGYNKAALLERLRNPKRYRLK